jgi:hypothetical protein
MLPRPARDGTDDDAGVQSAANATRPIGSGSWSSRISRGGPQKAARREDAARWGSSRTGRRWGSGSWPWCAPGPMPSKRRTRTGRCFSISTRPWITGPARDVLQYLIEERPASLPRVGQARKTALHRQGKDTRLGAVTYCVANRWENALHATDRCGAGSHCTPRGPLGRKKTRPNFDCVDIVRFLVEKCPETALVADHKGKIPLHILPRRAGAKRHWKSPPTGRVSRCVRCGALREESGDVPDPMSNDQPSTDS